MFFTLRFGSNWETTPLHLEVFVNIRLSFSLPHSLLHLLSSSVSALSNKPYMDWRQQLTKHFQSLYTVYIHFQLHHHFFYTNSTYCSCIISLGPENPSGDWWEMRIKLILSFDAFIVEFYSTAEPNWKMTSDLNKKLSGLGRVKH